MWQRRSDGETSSLSREKRVAQASLGERTRKLTPTKGTDQSRQVAGRGSKSPTKGQRDQNTGEQWELRPCGVSGTEGCPGAIKEAEAS